MKKLSDTKIRIPSKDIVKQNKQVAIEKREKEMSTLNTSSVLQLLKHRQLELEIEAIKNDEKLEYQETYSKDGYEYVSNNLTPYGKCIKAQSSIVRSGLNTILDHSTFEMYVPNTESQENALKTAKNFAKRPVGFITFLGASGVGKTHLSMAIARNLMINGNDLHMINWLDFKNQMSALAYAERNSEIYRLKQEPVLVIDDLFWVEPVGGRLSDIYQYEKDFAMAIIEYRSMNNLPTIITTNRTPKELRTISAGLAGRLKQESTRHGTNNYVVVIGEDYREKED